MLLTTMPQPLIVDQDILKTLSDAQINVSLASPMMSFQLYYCEIYFTDHPQIETAGACITQEKNLIFINPRWWTVALKNRKQRAYVLLHEVLHIFLEHGPRQRDNGYENGLWGKATDAVINNQCSGRYIDETGNVQIADRYKQYLEEPSNGIFMPQYVDWSSDKVYLDMQRDAQKSEGGKGSPGGDGESFDDIFYVDQDISSQITKNTQHALGSIIHAKNIGSDGVGANEAWMVRHFQSLVEPKFSYTELLYDAMSRTVTDEPTYNKVSRRNHGGIIFPAYTGTTINVAWVIDTSGSMGQEELTRSASELKGLLQEFDHWSLYLISVDVKAHVIGVYRKDEEHDFDLINVALIGGGGTDMGPAAEMVTELKESGEEIDAFILLTDGGFDTTSLENNMPRDTVNVIVVTEGGAKINVDGALVLYA